MSLLLRRMSPLDLLRVIGIFISVNIVLFFNFNWIFREPIGVWLLLVTLAITGAIIKYGRILHSKEDVSKLQWGVFFCFFTFLIVTGLMSFTGRIDEPRYLLPDPAFHYRYMTNGVQSGFMPPFITGKIYADSGNNPAFYYHEERYFPGSIGFFYILDKIFFFLKPIAMLQIFNIISYALIVLYLSYLLRGKTLEWSAKEISGLTLTVFLMAFGVFLNFLFTSYSTQMFGLFLLFLSVDTFWQFYSGNMKWYSTVFPIAALFLTYFYWIPVFVFFVLIVYLNEIIGMTVPKDKRHTLTKLSGTVFLALISIALVSGYIIFIFRSKYLAYSTSEGGFNFYSQFIDLIFFVLPFGITYLVYAIRNKKGEFLSLMSIAVILYSATLYGAYLLGFSSRYAFLKSYYLLIPILTILTVEFLFLLFDILRKQGMKSIFLNGYFWIATVLFIGAVFCGAEPNIYGPYKSNIKQTFFRDRALLLTTSQQKLLDMVKEKHPDVLQDGRILMITSPETSLWAYAYSGIWPRVPSLLSSQEENTGTTSPMTFYSVGIANYSKWIRDDSKHAFIYFDSKKSRSWVEKNGVSFDDYEILENIDGNKLLQLHSNTER